MQTEEKKVEFWGEGLGVLEVGYQIHAKRKQTQKLRSTKRHRAELNEKGVRTTRKRNTYRNKA